MSLTVLLVCACAFAADEEWVTGEVQDDTNYAERVAAYEQLLQDRSEFNLATNLWYRSGARGFDVYTRNRDLTARIASLLHVKGSSLVKRFNLRLPQSFSCQLYVYRDQAELRSHLPDDLEAFGLERWHEGASALCYQLDDDGRFRLSLLYDDIPYLLTTMALEEYAGRTPLPPAVRYGLAFVQQQSLSNALVMLAGSLADGEKSIWMPFQQLITFQPDPRDEPALLRSFNLSAAALAAYIEDAHGDAAMSALLNSLSSGATPGQAFGSALGLGEYDVLGKLEEDVVAWVRANYTPAIPPKSSAKVSKHTTISLAVVVVFIAVTVTLVSWFKQLVT